MKASTPVSNHVLMVRPTAFGFNSIAAESNAFQNKPLEQAEEIQRKALKEFDRAVEQLRNHGIEVTVFSDVPDSKTPDSIFPNNWFSTHATGELILYPMAVSNRRAERRADIVEHLIASNGYFLHDFSHFEVGDLPIFLEGTGSLVFDHENKLVYAALSPRTHKTLVERVAELLGYTAVVFTAYGKSGELIYHTNVMLCIGTKFVAIGMDTIAKEERSRVAEAIKKSRKRLIALTNNQVYNHFAGNMLQLENSANEKLLILSEAAKSSLTDKQVSELLEFNTHLVALRIPTIEFIGGGSARCMLAEIYPPAKTLQS